MVSKTSPNGKVIQRFMKPVNNILMNGDVEVDDIALAQHLGISAMNHLFQHNSHENNLKVWNGYKSKNDIQYNRIMIVAHQNKEHYGEDSGTGEKVF